MNKGLDIFSIISQSHQGKGLAVVGSPSSPLFSWNSLGYLASQSADGSSIIFMVCMLIHSSSFSSHHSLEGKLPFSLTTAPLTALSIMSSFGHTLNALSIFLRKMSQQLTQEIFTLTALALTVPRIFLIFLGEKTFNSFTPMFFNLCETVAW